MNNKTWFIFSFTICFQINAMEEATLSGKILDSEENSRITIIRNKSNQNYYLKFKDANNKNILDKVTGENFAKWPQDCVAILPKGSISIENESGSDIFARVWEYEHLTDNPDHSIMGFKWKENHIGDFIPALLQFDSQVYSIVTLYVGSRLVTMQYKKQIGNSQEIELLLPHKPEDVDGPLTMEVDDLKPLLFTVKASWSNYRPFTNLQERDQKIAAILQKNKKLKQKLNSKTKVAVIEN